MLDNKILKNRLISRRTFLIIFGKIFLFFLLLIRLIYLQFFKKDEFEELSRKNRLSLLIIPPLRGLLKDKNNKILAENQNSFSVKLDRRQVKNYQESLAKLFLLLNYDEEKKQLIIEKVKKSSIRIPVTLDINLSWNDVAKIEERLFELPGIFVESNDIRSYADLSMSHIIGYVGKASENDIKEYDYKFLPELQVGKTGIEKKYENILSGKIGYRQMEVNAHGLYISEVSRVEPVAGKDLILNIDIELQNEIYKMLDQRGASVVVSDVKTGGILSLVSAPTYDSNKFIGGVSHKYWNSLRGDIYKPLINKSIQSQYPPGSTFKIVTILAALENGLDYRTKFNCSGSIQLGNHKFNCWNKNGHGQLDMMGGIRHSCNCYMYNIALAIGHQPIIEMARRLGLGKKTGVDLPSEVKGFVPDRKWKLNNFKYDWSKGDSLNMSIGQGALLVTPIQLVNLISSIANGGMLNTPRIIDPFLNNINQDLSEDLTLENIDLKIKKDHIDFIQRGLFEVINVKGGTGFFNRSNRFNYAGKTGTAQVKAKKNAADDLSRNDIEWAHRNHGLFVGFAPFENPKYAISVVADHGGSGSGAAAPIAKKIFELLI